MRALSWGTAALALMASVALGWLAWSGGRPSHRARAAAGPEPGSETVGARAEPRLELDPPPPVRTAAEPLVAPAREVPSAVEFDSAEVEEWLARARVAAATQPLDREALAELGRIEDEVLRIFERVFRRAENERGGALAKEWIARKDSCQRAYQEMLRISDEAVYRFFTLDVIAATPWRDLLADPRAWTSNEPRGFVHDFSHGVLRLVGPDASERAEGLSSVGDREAWRDLEIEIELTVVRGGCSLYFRLPPVYQKNVEQVDLTTEEGQLEVGRSYAFGYRLIGSSCAENGESAAETIVRPISWTQTRKGGFGLSIPKDSEVVISRPRARILR